MGRSPRRPGPAWARRCARTCAPVPTPPSAPLPPPTWADGPGPGTSPARDLALDVLPVDGGDRVHGQVAAVDREHDPGDHGGGRRGQEQHGTDDLGRLT